MAKKRGQRIGKICFDALKALKDSLKALKDFFRFFSKIFNGPAGTSSVIVIEIPRIKSIKHQTSEIEKK